MKEHISQNEESQNLIIPNKNPNFSSSELSKIPKFSENSEIFSINFSNNNIKTIENLELLKNLKKINLSYNNITEIEGFEGCKSLESLNLSNNMINSLTKFVKMPNLLEIILDKNALKELKCWDQMRNLKKISACSNKIEEIGFLPNYNKIEEMFLFDNQLKFISNNIFEHGDSLLHLDLSKNLIKTIQFLKPLKNLQTLDLSKNCIETIDDSIKLENLENLNISENFISTTEGFENYFPSLFTLDISSNQLLSLYELKFCNELPYLYDLNIKNNPFYAEDLDEEIRENYPNLSRLNRKEIRNLGNNIQDQIKELKKDLKNTNDIEDDFEFNSDVVDSDNLSKAEYIKNMRQMKDPLSISIKIKNEQELDDQLFKFNSFLGKSLDDLSILRNKYICIVGKNKFIGLKRNQSLNNTMINENNENDENCVNKEEQKMNKSLTNFKNFIVRKQKNNNPHVPRSASNAGTKLLEKPMPQNTVFPFTSINNVPVKLVPLKHNDIKVKKLIKGNLKGEKFIEHLRERLEINNDILMKLKIKKNSTLTSLLKKNN